MERGGGAKYMSIQIYDNSINQEDQAFLDL